MSLADFKSSVNVAWRFEGQPDASLDLQPISQAGKFSYSLRGIDLEVYGEALIGQIELAGGGTLTVDLSSFINLITEVTGLTEVIAMYFQAAPADEDLNDCAAYVGPGDTNGFTGWFTAPVKIPFRGAAVFLGPVEPTGTEGPGYPVSSAHKNLKFTNPGSHSILLSYCIAGKV